MVSGAHHGWAYLNQGPLAKPNGVRLLVPAPNHITDQHYRAHGGPDHESKGRFLQGGGWEKMSGREVHDPGTKCLGQDQHIVGSRIPFEQ